MLLLIRFLIASIASVLRSRIDPLDESVIRMTVLPNDCDLNFHLNAGRFVSFMDVGRMDLIGRARLLRPLLRRGWRPVMGGIVVRYRRSVLPFERCDIRSRVVGWDDKWIYVEHIVERKGILCAVGIVRTLVRKKDGNASPRDVLALLGREDLDSPPLPPFVAEWRDAEDRR